MSTPEPDEVLFAYIAVAFYAVSLVLIWVDYGVQQPVYYVSKSLHEAEVRYLLLEKAILAVVLAHVSCPITSRHTQLLFLPNFRLKPYSECRLHRKSSQVGYNSRAFDIKYMPRTSIKGPVLADLVAEFTEPQIEELELTENMDDKLVGTISQYGFLAWEVYVDGASNQKGSGIGLVLISPKKVIIENLWDWIFWLRTMRPSMKLCW